MNDRDATAEFRRVSPAQVVEALLFAPIGLGAKVVTETPERLRQFRSDLNAARFIGEMAVTRGAEQLRARQSRGADEAAAPARATPPTPPPPADIVDRRGEPPADRSADGDRAHEEAPSVDDLAIVDYDSVPAIDVVAQLADLDASERAVIERYERAHRGRRTILGKLRQLDDAS